MKIPLTPGQVEYLRGINAQREALEKEAQRQAALMDAAVSAVLLGVPELEGRDRIVAVDVNLQHGALVLELAPEAPQEE